MRTLLYDRRFTLIYSFNAWQFKKLLDVECVVMKNRLCIFRGVGRNNCALALINRDQSCSLPFPRIFINVHFHAPAPTKK